MHRRHRCTDTIAVTKLANPFPKVAAGARRISCNQLAPAPATSVGGDTPSRIARKPWHVHL
jgi:hypothetical protein